MAYPSEPRLINGQHYAGDKCTLSWPASLSGRILWEWLYLTAAGREVPMAAITFVLNYFAPQESVVHELDMWYMVAFPAQCFTFASMITYNTPGQIPPNRPTQHRLASQTQCHPAMFLGDPLKHLSRFLPDLNCAGTLSCLPVIRQSQHNPTATCPPSICCSQQHWKRLLFYILLCCRIAHLLTYPS